MPKGALPSMFPMLDMTSKFIEMIFHSYLHLTISSTLAFKKLMTYWTLFSSKNMHITWMYLLKSPLILTNVLISSTKPNRFLACNLSVHILGLKDQNQNCYFSPAEDATCFYLNYWTVFSPVLVIRWPILNYILLCKHMTENRCFPFTGLIT